jgi:hypothetical protein
MSALCVVNLSSSNPSIRCRKGRSIIFIITGGGKYHDKNGNLVKGIVAAFMMMGIVACAMISSPPQDLVAKNDHVGLEAFYVNEAAHLRQRAKDMTAMAEAYQKNPGPSTRGVLSPKTDMVFHCQALGGMYTKAADEADVMARAHREMTGR